MRRSTCSIAVLSVATALSLAVPSTASASSTYGVTNSPGGAASAPSAQAPSGVDTTDAFPSSNSLIVGSVGFIDGEQAGYFWSVARGDSVSETVDGPGKVRKATLKLDVISNGLVNGAEVDWTLSIDGKDVGRFVVNEGQTGPLKAKYKFDAIKSVTYDVEIRVTNEVAPGEGAITLRYAGDGPHSIKLKK